MTFPSGTTISTANLDSADDDPSLARADLYNMAVAVNSIIASENTASGVLVLDGSGQVPSANMPATLNPTSTQTISPGNKIVNIRDVLRMQQRYVEDNALLTSSTAGDIIYLVDGDGGDRRDVGLGHPPPLHVRGGFEVPPYVGVVLPRQRPVDGICAGYRHFNGCLAD
jgi:hypothetical protein